jgi:hypothetical protein
VSQPILILLNLFDRFVLDGGTMPDWALWKLVPQTQMSISNYVLPALTAKEINRFQKYMSLYYFRE